MSSDDQTTKAKPIRVPQAMWDAYGAVCKKLGTDRTKDLLEHMRRQINRHGDEEHLDKLAEAEKELAERRARMHPGRPRKEDRVE
jgi:hypothetical protein